MPPLLRQRATDGYPARTARRNSASTWLADAKLPCMGWGPRGAESVPASATRLWGLASAGRGAVGSGFAPARDQGQGIPVHPGVVSDALPASDASIEPALANASSSGISHLRVVASRDVPLLGPSDPGAVVVRHLRDGRLAVDAALVAD